MDAFSNSLSPFTSFINYGHGGDPTVITVYVNRQQVASHAYNSDPSRDAFLSSLGFRLGAALGHGENELYPLG